MLDEGELTAAIERLTDTDLDAPPRGEVVIVRRGLRRRSTIYFVGRRRDDATTLSWVVKRPWPDAARLGIRPPMSAAEQYAALERLHHFLSEGDSQFASPRPVALLPELDALVMEFVEGRSVWDLAVPSALYRPQRLREAVRTAALALRHLHTIEPVGEEDVDLAEVEEAAARDAQSALALRIGPTGSTCFRPAASTRVPARVVLLHGDWAPENVMLGDDRVFLLDPELTHRGWPEHDLARFLMMLWDRSVFVATGALWWSVVLRRELTRIFLTTYYDGEAVSPLLRPLLLREVAQRWAVREEEARRGSRVATQARSLLLSHYFGTLLAEVGDEAWSASAVRRRP